MHQAWKFNNKNIVHISRSQQSPKICYHLFLEWLDCSCSVRNILHIQNDCHSANL